MANIVPKLNLNKTPSIVDNNSLVFAKNIRLDVDKTIHRDWSILPQNLRYRDGKWLFNKDFISTISHDFDELIYNQDPNNPLPKRILDDINKFINTYTTVGASPFKIVGWIPDNNSYFVFLYCNNNGNNVSESHIVEYKEDTDSFYPCPTNWTYGGGEISGNLIKNLRGDRLLIVAEKPNDKDKTIPLKVINITTSSINDEEFIYTQNPDIPIINLLFDKNIPGRVPCGVYQFFIRYKISDNYYTSWYPASKELFIGNKVKDYTNFGPLYYENKHLDSDHTVSFTVEHLIDLENNSWSNIYESFQIGFIISHDDSIMARAWEHFNLDTTTISFVYNHENAEEIEVSELLESSFQLYNVGNITLFKNKAYVSNYKETDFNDTDIETLAKDNVVINIVEKSADDLTDKKDDEDVDTEIEQPSRIATPRSGNTYTFNSDKSRLSKINNQKLQYILYGMLCPTGGGKLSVFANTQALFSGSEINRGLYTRDILHGQTRNSGTYDLEQAREQLKLSNPDKVYDFENETKVGHLYLRIGDYATYVANVEITNTNNISAIDQAYKELFANIVTLGYENGHFTNYYYNANGISKPFIVLEVCCDRYCPSTNKPSQPIPDRYTYDENGNIVYNPTIQNPNFNNSINIQKTENSENQSVRIGYEGPTYSTKFYVDFWFDDLPDNAVILTDGSSGGSGGGNTGGDGDNTPGGEGSSSVSTEMLDYQTLIPSQSYNIYIHYVYKNGTTSNGYFVKRITMQYKPSTKLYYPVFRNIDKILNDERVACFFSIEKCNNYTSQLIAPKLIHEILNSAIEKAKIIGENYDFDLGTNLSNFYDIQLYQHPNHTTGNYYNSNDTKNLFYFGGPGIIEAKDTMGMTVSDIPEDKLYIDIDKNIYVSFYYTKQRSDDSELVKCTPYINRKNLTEAKDENGNIITDSNGNTIYEYNNYKDGNLLGYICKTYPLDIERTLQLYTDGTSVYKKVSGTYTTPETEDDIVDNYLQLKELHKYTKTAYGDGVPKISDITNMMSTKPYYFYCNYNFNHLHLRDDVKFVNITYYDAAEDDSNSSGGNTSIGGDTENPDDPFQGNGTSSSKNKVTALCKFIPSLNLSLRYELPSMYKNYTRKLFYPFKKDSQTEFNNTIRSSLLIGDEERYNMIKFDAADYYNVSPEKGNIVNLKGVGNGIIVHTEDSLFNFSGSNTLVANDGNIETSESQPFDTGISEVFGSDFGYAGLQSKNHQVLCEAGYIFFDRKANSIYNYAGNNQLKRLNDNIYKLMNCKPIKDVVFANDSYNKRIFVGIIFEDDTPITLSYSLIDDVLDFVSIHDFVFDKSFNTRTKCYFVSDRDEDGLDRLIFKIDKHLYGLYLGNYKASSLYPYNGKVETIPIIGLDEIESENINGYSATSIVDIIYNANYETIKTLDSISWISKFVDKEFTNKFGDIDFRLDSPMTKMAECIEDYNDIPMSSLMVYSDTCMSEVIAFKDRSNNYSIDYLESYKYPRYNQGKWSANYFRNIEHTTDIFNYEQKYDDGRNHSEIKPDFISNVNSLIEGKYFVTRFCFDREFKFENITLNFTNKL